MKRKLIAVLLCMCFITLPITGCKPYTVVSPTGESTEYMKISEDLLLRTAQSLDAISIGCNATVDIVLEIMPQNSSRRQAILNTISDVVRVLMLAQVAVEELDKIENLTTSQIAKALLPFITEMKEQINANIFMFSDAEAETKAKVQKWLSVVSLAIMSAESMLKVYE